jgi:hypothetical protein
MMIVSGLDITPGWQTPGKIHLNTLFWMRSKDRRNPMLSYACTIILHNFSDIYPRPFKLNEKIKFSKGTLH